MAANGSVSFIPFQFTFFPAGRAALAQGQAIDASAKTAASAARVSSEVADTLGSAVAGLADCLSSGAGSTVIPEKCAAFLRLLTHAETGAVSGLCNDVISKVRASLHQLAHGAFQFASEEVGSSDLHGDL